LISKTKLLSVLLAVVLCMTAFSVTAFADGYYASNEDGDNTPPDSLDNITVSTEDVKLPENQGGDRLTPDGNLTLIDDILQSESFESVESELKEKQFITVQSKNGNYFYLVIDRDGDSENVYFLNLVDEADLLALMEDGETETTPAVCSCTDKCIVGNINTACEVCHTSMSACVGKEAVKEPDPGTDTGEEPTDEPNPNEQSGKSMLIVVVLVLAIAGGGAAYWFKFRKPKDNTSGNNDLDDYDYGQDDEDEETEIDDADVMNEAEEIEDEGE